MRVQMRHSTIGAKGGEAIDVPDSLGADLIARGQARALPEPEPVKAAAKPKKPVASDED